MGLNAGYSLEFVMNWWSMKADCFGFCLSFWFIWFDHDLFVMCLVNFGLHVAFWGFQEEHFCVLTSAFTLSFWFLNLSPMLSYLVFWIDSSHSWFSGQMCCTIVQFEENLITSWVGEGVLFTSAFKFSSLRYLGSSSVSGFFNFLLTDI